MYPDVSLGLLESGMRLSLVYVPEPQTVLWQPAFILQSTASLIRATQRITGASLAQLK